MLRLRIRHLMLLVLYVAVILALTMPAIRTRGPDRVAFILATVLGVPMAMAAFSALILRPGPHRDWLTCFFVTIPMTFLALVLTIGTLMGAMTTKEIAGTWREPVNWVIWSLVDVLLWVVVIALGRGFLVPKQCPRCRKISLLQAFYLDAERPQNASYGHYRCGVCEYEALLTRSEAHQACPHCGRTTWSCLWKAKDGSRRSWSYHYKYKFYWCLACGARCKQLLPGDRKEATSLEDERYYWLWSFRGWLRARIDRVAKQARALK
jgi:hypothetical protein